MNITAFIKSWLFLAKQSVRLWMAIKLCDLKQSAFNRRYFVILDSNDNLISLSREDVNRMKRRRMINKEVTHTKLMEDSFYYTKLSDNNSMTKDEMLKKKKLYFQYVSLKNRK